MVELGASMGQTDGRTDGRTRPIMWLIMTAVIYRVAQKIGTIGHWRRRLECVVQQQGGHTEHLMQKLQDVTVTLDNN